jgi:dTDP-4-dehydrorhamnose reductase
MCSELIIGGNSQLGIGLASHFDASGIDYIKTTRNRINDRKDIFLELSEFEGNFALPDSIKTAYLLAGISDTRYCEANQKNTRHINVTKTLELIRFLDSNSVHTVFVSSASVFDGGKRTYHVDEVKQPRNFYGECKSEVEDVILKESLNASILRVGKIIGELPIIEKWKSQIHNGERPKVYSNRYISPLAIEGLIKNLSKLGDKAIGGVSQISACDEISYLELFDRLFPGQARILISDGTLHELLEPSGLFVDFSPPPSWAAMNHFI